jgi:hypothetical protein
MERRSFRAAKAAEWNGTVGIFRAEVNWALEVVSPDCLLGVRR